MNYLINKIEYYLPEKIIDNVFLESECGIEKGFLENKIGIKFRHVAEKMNLYLTCHSKQRGN